MRPTLGAIALLSCVVAAAPAARQGLPGVVTIVKSPDGRTTIELHRAATAHHNEGGALFYRVRRDGHDVIAESPLGLQRG